MNLGQLQARERLEGQKSQRTEVRTSPLTPLSLDLERRWRYVHTKGQYLHNI